MRTFVCVTCRAKRQSGSRENTLECLKCDGYCRATDYVSPSERCTVFTMADPERIKALRRIREQETL
jgi:hypothetical protein